MALPIKAKDTQEGCNPISSNCVLWQGPDIPCINLCKGDSISDITAKLAEELCTLLEQTDVSTYDISCFNPVCPSPKDFHDLIQLLIERICALYNLPTTASGGAGCPDCVVPVAQCLQKPDALGNITATLQLKDYVILIGNQICSILTSITSLDARVTSLESAVTDIQNNCCSSSGGTTLTMPASICLKTPDGTPVVDYLIALDTAFCALQQTAGSAADTNTSLSYKCISGNDTTQGASGFFNNVPGWIESPTNIAQSVQDLWLIVCDQYAAITQLNSAIQDLETQLGECCNVAVGCSSIQLIANAWFETTLGQGYYIVVSFNQALSQFPDGWYFCPDAMLYHFYPSNVDPSTPLPPGAVFGGTDFDKIHYPGPWRTASLTIPSGNPWSVVTQALYVDMDIDACVTNGTEQCFVKITIPTIQGLGAQTVDVTMLAGGTPEAPEVTGTIYKNGYPFVDSINTSWVMYLRLNNNDGPIVASHTFTSATQGSALNFTFNTGLLAGQSYGMTVDIFQRTYSKTGIQALNNAITPAAMP